MRAAYDAGHGGGSLHPPKCRIASSTAARMSERLRTSPTIVRTAAPWRAATSSRSDLAASG